MEVASAVWLSRSFHWGIVQMPQVILAVGTNSPFHNKFVKCWKCLHSLPMCMTFYPIIVWKLANPTYAYAVVTRQIKLFQNYFTGLLQLMNIFQHVHCRWNISWNNNRTPSAAEIYFYFGFRCGYMCKIKHLNNFTNYFKIISATVNMLENVRELR